MSPPGAVNPIGGGEKYCGSKVTWPKLKCISIRRTRNVDLGWVNMHTYNFFVS